jgi:hypothetical protein
MYLSTYATVVTVVTVSTVLTVVTVVTVMTKNYVYNFFPLKIVREKTWTQIVTNLKTQKPKCWQNLKTQIVTKLKKHNVWQNLKTQIVTKLKKSICDKNKKSNCWIMKRICQRHQCKKIFRSLALV